jgi:hypothetical protein
MAGTPIRGRDNRSYEALSNNTGAAPLKRPYTKERKVSQPEGATADYTGNEALFNRYNTFFYSGAYGFAGSKNANLFEDDRGWNYQEIQRNPTAAKLIEWSRNGTNSIEYNWPDFLWCKHYGKVPNNYMITLRRFGAPANDNLINPEAGNFPDIGRLVAYMDGDKNKLEDLLKFKVKLNWKEFKSEIQTYQGSSYGGNGGGGNLLGKILGATDTAGSKTALQGTENANHDPYSNMTNKTLGPIDVVDKMQVRDRGLVFEQSIKITFEYEMRSIDGINEKAAFLDLLMNVLQCTYNRGDFWGGAKRFVGGARASNPIAGQEGMAKLASGDFGGFLGDLADGFVGRIDELTGGAGLSLEGIGNAIKSVGGNIASRAAGGAMDKMGRPQAQATMALLTGEDTGQWHVMVGNPTRPMLSMGNMILEDTEIQFGGPLNKDDFPTKLTVTCSLKPARPRDRDDVQMMFVPNNQERVYSSALDYLKSTYYGQVGPNFGGDGDKTKSQAPGTNLTPNDEALMAGEENSFANLLAARFPNHGGGQIEGSTKWTT